jgi:hypothetical protein
VKKAAEIGSFAEMLPPDALGRYATSLQPYIKDGILPPETTATWRAAAAEMARWVFISSRIGEATPEDRLRARGALIARLQQVDAWPYPSGALVGTFGRALWSVWPRITQQRAERRCAWPGCAIILPPDAHGNRTQCDAHQREAARLRAARTRQRARSSERLAPPA